MAKSRKITGCSLTIFIAGMMAFGYPGVMGLYWQEKFQTGVAETGMIVTFMLLALAVAMFFSGKIHKRTGMDTCVLIGLGFYLLAFLILHFAQNIYWVYAWGFVANLGCSFWYGPGLTTGQQVLPEKKGLISGILNLCFGISAAIMSPILNRLLESRGYGTTNLVVISMIVLAAAGSYLLNKEEKIEKTYSHSVSDPKMKLPGNHELPGNYEVPGTNEPEVNNSLRKAALNNGRSESSGSDLTVGEALRTKDFWIMWLIWAFMGAAGISMVSLSKSYAISLGMASVALLTVFNLANGISRIIVGLCMDKIGGKITGMAAFAMACAGYLLMSHFTGYEPLCLCAIGVGIGFGTLFTISGPIAVNLFGLQNFGMIFGLIFTGYGLVGGIAGPAISGFLLQKTNGNYGVVFTYLGIMALLGMVLMWFVETKKRR